MKNTQAIPADDIASFDSAFMGHPKPLRSLFLTEMWERFSFYGVRPLLILYMIALINEGGLGMERPTAAAVVGLYTGALYLASLPGGWLADNWLGQQRAVWYGSLIIALGHISIALSAAFGSALFFIGLVFIVVGTGLFKTCASVMVGALYSEGDPRRNGGFSVFYMGINLGAFIAPFICGAFTETLGWHWGFGVGGVGMLAALLIFRLVTGPQMRRFAVLKNIEPSWEQPNVRRKGVGKVVAGIVVFAAGLITLVVNGTIPVNPHMLAEVMTYVICACLAGYFVYLLFFAKFTALEKVRLLASFILLAMAVLFLAILEQQPTSYNLFAQDFTNRVVFGFEIPTTWFQALGPLFVIISAPVFSYVWVGLAKKNMEPSNISKFAIALLFCALGFGLMILAVNGVIATGLPVSPLWITASFLLLSIGEVCLSPIGLSSMTELAPTSVRGQMMGLWFAATALGNLTAGLIGGNVSLENIHALPELFTRCVVVLLAAVVFLFIINKPLSRKLSGCRNGEKESPADKLSALPVE